MKPPLLLLIGRTAQSKYSLHRLILLYAELLQQIDVSYEQHHKNEIMNHPTLLRFLPQPSPRGRKLVVGVRVVPSSTFWSVLSLKKKAETENNGAEDDPAVLQRKRDLMAASRILSASRTLSSSSLSSSKHHRHHQQQHELVDNNGPIVFFQRDDAAASALVIAKALESSVEDIIRSIEEIVVNAENRLRVLNCAMTRFLSIFVKRPC